MSIQGTGAARCTVCNHQDRSANRPEVFGFSIHRNDDEEICGPYLAMLLIHKALHTLFVHLNEDRGETRRVFDGIADLMTGGQPIEAGDPHLDHGEIESVAHWMTRPAKLVRSCE